MSKATISDQGHDRVILRTTRAHRDFIDELKATIPRSSREWSPAGRRWFIHRDCLPRIEALVRRHFDTVQINRPRTSETRSSQ